MGISNYLQGIRSRVGHELLLVPAVAAIIRNDDGYILFQQRSDDGNWSLPAGSIDPGETPSQAIIREVWEETGLTVTVERVLGVFGGPGFTVQYGNGDTCQYTTTVFLCKRQSGDLGGHDDETLDLKYFPSDSIPKLRLAYPKELFEPDGDVTLFI